MSLGSQRVAGLDIGQTSTKLVVLEKKGDGARLVKTAIFRNREEGIIDTEELGEHLLSWLREQNCSNLDHFLGLPQYMVMTQIADFPPGSESKLEEMVSYETQQLAGLTDEAFIHDHRRLKGFYRYQNPVLIAVCRESMVTHQLEILDARELKINNLFMNGQALYTSFLNSRPDKAPESMFRQIVAGDTYVASHPDKALDGIGLLLDIGAENTTLTVVFEGQILHVSSFLFGGDFFTEALARHLGSSELETEKTKRNSRLNLEDSQSPLTRTAQNFVVELESALDNWRGHDPEASKLKVAAVYLSGGGSRLTGFAEYLQKTYNCPVESLAPTAGGKTGEDGALYSIAYGLALQGLAEETPAEALSLAPPRLRWLTRRRKRIPHLFAAAGLLALLCIGYFALSFFVELNFARPKLKKRREELFLCEAIVPELKKSKEAIKRYQQMLQPFAARGNRDRTCVRGLELLSQAKQEGDWFYFMADPLSYVGATDPFEFRRSAAKTGGNRSLLGTPVGSRTQEPEQEVVASSVMPWQGLVVSGFTLVKRQNPLENVKKMKEILNQSQVFKGVDMNPDLSSKDAQVMKPWSEIFRMRPFSLICPLAEVEFGPEKNEGKSK